MKKLENLPNFIIVGAAKSGTTALYHHLKAHPDIFMPDFKEPHYFVVEEKLNFEIIKNEKDYRLLFNGYENSLCGEASTGYLYFDDAAENIKKLIPDCKIIALVRDPAARAFSMWGHQVREGLEERSFEEAVSEELRGKIHLNQGVEYGFNYCKLGLISEQLIKYKVQFGESNVFIGDYELLRSDPARLMTEIHHFLGVKDVTPARLKKRYNASGKPKFSGLHSFLNSKSRIRSLLTYPAKKLMGEKFTHTAWQTLRNYNINSGARHIMPENTRELLRE